MADQPVKPIETRYKGYRFRSRLEARWAVFFDVIGFDWSYEPEGFETEGGRYLPDFEIRDPESPEGFRQFVEVKGGGKNTIPVSDRQKCEAFIRGGVGGLLLLSEVPEWRSGSVIFHPYLFVDEQLNFERRWAMPGIGRFNYLPRIGPLEIVLDLVGERSYWPHALDAQIPAELPADFWETSARYAPAVRWSPKAREAYQAARAARFEHGENPAPAHA